MIDEQVGGHDRQSACGRRFRRQSGRYVAAPAPAGAAARVLLTASGTRAAFGRKQYRKAVLVSAQALAKTGATDAVVYLALEDMPGMDGHFRARAVAEIFSVACLQDSRPEERRQAEAAQARRGAVAADKRACRRSRPPRVSQIGVAIGNGSALARDLGNLPPNICTPTYLGKRAEELDKSWSRIKTKVLDEEAIKALKMGAFLAVTQGSAQPPRFIVSEYRGGEERRRPDLPDRQGHHFRFGRNLAQGSAGHGRDEIRHGRRRRRCSEPCAQSPSSRFRSTSSASCRLARTCRAARP